MWKGSCWQAAVITTQTQTRFNHHIQKSIFPIARAISKSRQIHYKREKKGSVKSSATTRNAQKVMDLNWIKVSRKGKKRTATSSKKHSDIRRIMINISRDTKWHKIRIKKNTFNELHCKPLWIFNFNQIEMKESTQGLWIWILKDN